MRQLSKFEQFITNGHYAVNYTTTSGQTDYDDFIASRKMMMEGNYNFYDNFSDKNTEFKLPIIFCNKVDRILEFLKCERVTSSVYGFKIEFSFSDYVDPCVDQYVHNHATAKAIIDTALKNAEYKELIVVGDYVGITFDRVDQDNYDAVMKLAKKLKLLDKIKAYHISCDCKNLKKLIKLKNKKISLIESISFYFMHSKIDT